MSLVPHTKLMSFWFWGEGEGQAIEYVSGPPELSQDPSLHHPLVAFRRLRQCSLLIASNLSGTICERFRYRAVGSKLDRSDRNLSSISFNLSQFLLHQNDTYLLSVCRQIRYIVPSSEEHRERWWKGQLRLHSVLLKAKHICTLIISLSFCKTRQVSAFCISLHPNSHPSVPISSYLA